MYAMKSIIIALMMAFAPFFAMAQLNPISSFFDKYAGQEGFTSVNVSADLFGLLSSMEGNSEIDEVKDLVKGLKGIQVLAYEAKSGKHSGEKLYQEALGQLNVKAYKELVSVKDGKENVLLLARDLGNGTIDHMMVLVGSPDEFVFVSIAGIIDLNKIMKMGDSMNIKGMDKLKHLEEKK